MSDDGADLNIPAEVAPTQRSASVSFEKIWWLSFADSKLPQGSQFLGVAIVEAYSMKGAVFESHTKGINPGGEIKIAQIADKYADRVRPYMYKLLSKKELEEADLL